MKLSELGLSAKPQTKYFTHGYISFSIQDDELSYSITFRKTKSSISTTTEKRIVQNKEHFETLMKLESKEVEA